jgi:hypothetical protein
MEPNAIPPAELKAAIIEQTKRLCRDAYQDGLRKGYQRGFEAGCAAALGAVPRDPAYQLTE